MTIIELPKAGYPDLIHIHASTVFIIYGIILFSLTQLKSPCDYPGLAEVMEVVINGIVHSCNQQHTAVKLVEGLLAHFFSLDFPTYNQEDVEWFLMDANKQKQWCYKSFQVKVSNYY